MVLEPQKQATHVLTKDEIKQLEQYERYKKKYRYAFEPKFRKYDYIPMGRLTFSVYRDRYIRNTDTVGIESRVGELLLDLYMQSEVVRIDR